MGSQSGKMNQPQASARAEEKLLAVSMSEMELKTGNSMPDRQSRPTSRAATKNASANNLWAALRCSWFKAEDDDKEDIKWDRLIA